MHFLYFDLYFDVFRLPFQQRLGLSTTSQESWSWTPTRLRRKTVVRGFELPFDPDDLFPAGKDFRQRQPRAAAFSQSSSWQGRQWFGVRALSRSIPPAGAGQTVSA